MKTLLKLAGGAVCAFVLSAVFAPVNAAADHVRHFAGYDAWGRPVYHSVRVVPYAYPARAYAPYPPPRYYHRPYAGVTLRWGPAVFHGSRHYKAYGHRCRGHGYSHCRVCR